MKIDVNILVSKKVNMDKSYACILTSVMTLQCMLLFTKEACILKDNLVLLGQLGITLLYQVFGTDPAGCK